MTDRIDVLVVGAGAVGLACAVALARQGRGVLVLERTSAIGSETSSRNSEVVHGGMYYPTGGLKQRLCIEGRRALYDYMETRGIAHRRCGKLIVATTPDEVGQIERIHEQGARNGVERLSLLTGPQAMELEPALSCLAALSSPETGILDSHGLLSSLQGELEANGGHVVLNTMVDSIRDLGNDGFLVQVDGDEAFHFIARSCVNAAGLYAQGVASKIEGLDGEYIPGLTLAKGSYFTAATKPVFSRLIYPAPVHGGLGVHVTLDLAGRMRFGPDVEWLEHADPDLIDYQVDPARADVFYAAIRRYWPGLPDGCLQPDYSGCRPKVDGADFRIDGSEFHGVAGLINLFGIESPGLTSALAIADVVAARLD